jgi:hypothetical protein
MPVKTVQFSNVTGELIPEGTGARVRVVFGDPDKGDMRIDLADAEVNELVERYNAEPVKARPYRAGEKRNRS